MAFTDYYQVLGVPREASAADIKKAYRKLARQHHPDLNPGADATDRMAGLNEAHEVLGDAERRTAYDALGPDGRAQDGQGWQPPPGWDDAGFGGDGDADGGDHSAFFEQLFGRQARARQQGRGGTPRPVAGGDRHARIELDLVDAYRGADRTLTLRGTRLDSAGQVVDELTHLQVHLPKGVREGQLVRLAGKGGAGSHGGPDGDLLLEVAFKPDARWQADGRDVTQRLALAPWEAALGATITVHTPSGETEVTIPAGSQAGRRLRLKGRGIPGAGGHADGHLFLALELLLPPADSDAARTAYAALAHACPGFQPRPRS